MASQHRPNHLRAIAWLAAACGACGALAGCSSIADQEGLLPDAVRAATAQATGADYPDLSKIPPAPVALPDRQTWREFEWGLEREARQLAANPAAAPLTQAQLNDDWGRAARDALLADPRSAPPTLNDDPAAWAAAERARMDALFARLPAN
jgi:hypothetical protein